MSNSSDPRRLPSETYTVPFGQHIIEFSVGWHPQTGHAMDVIFVNRGKIGHEMDMMLTDLGIALSRALQGRDPLSGCPQGDLFAGGLGTGSGATFT